MKTHHLPEIPAPLHSLREAARQLSQSTDDLSALLALNRLDAMANNMATVEKQALAWRSQYDVELKIWQNSEPRSAPTSLRCATKPNCKKAGGDCGARLQFKAWRAAQGEEAARLALLLTDHARQESHGLGEFKTDLADLARIVELFNGEEERR